ncbi:outer membrane beta-barrel protein [Dysgonomonas sp. 25]|uniref:outer membrane beta-barrel protein n=1 Tax=Dysgonomonas sp. 25 TaxID=2302933 RepID=UPI0013D0785F|nr:outer membrane beta-barrel protein [Dysgonomonas sp. 25]NDV69799.1 TonB-dependent receptor [Dysgonomonas sp. 25]
MKKASLTLFILFITSCLFAQNSQNITIKGSVLDNTTKEIIESASVRILNARDSSYVTGTVTDEKGNFSLTIPGKRYIVELSFMGFDSQYFNVSPRQNNGNIGQVYLSESSILLQEAVVTAKAVEILVKGDTVEYNADSYKTQESAVVEDLIKKIPGAEVDSDGKITINGKEISKILVDGKEFFSDDPKVASKNLPAKMVEKLQVLDKKSDMAQLTGFDDGEEETVINLTVKPGMKEGLFGNFLGGYGSRGRYEGNGMVNYMRNSTQLTVLGGLNNTNNAGATDFASSMRQGGPPRGLTFGSNNGVATTNNIGVNFATEVKDKLKVSGDVRFNSIDNDVTSDMERDYGTNDMRERMTSLAKGNNKSQSFGTNFRFEWKPDTLTQIVFRPSFQYNKNKNRQYEKGETYYASGKSDLSYTEDTTAYYSDADGWNTRGDLMLSRRLSNSGRTITFRVAGGYSETNSDAYNYSDNIYHFADLRPDSIPPLPIDQKSVQDDKSYNWRASVSYVEPLGRNNFLELQYTARNNYSDADKNVYSNDLLDNYGMRVDSVSRRIENDFTRHNVTLSFQSMREKFNYTIGLGLEPNRTKTTTTDPVSGKTSYKPINTTFFAPRARFNYMWSKRKNLRIDYYGSASQPSTRQLFDGIYSDNGNKIEIGNPNLRPSFENRLHIRYQNFNPEQGSAFMIFARLTYKMKDIVSTTIWEEKNGTPLEVATYKNVDGNMSANARVIYNTPLRNRKFSFNTMTFASYSRTNSFVSPGQGVDALKNTANNYRIQENAGLRFTSDLFDFTVRGNMSYNKVKNNVSNNNRNVWDYGGYADFTLHLPYNFHIDSDLTYSDNSGYNDGFDKKEWLWNASIAKDFLKAKNATIRVKMYDILQDRSNVSWTSNQNYTQSTRYNTINSYVMINLVYRFQIFKGGAKMGDMQPQGGFGPGGHRGGPPR